MNFWSVTSHHVKWQLSACKMLYPLSLFRGQEHVALGSKGALQLLLYPDHQDGKAATLSLHRLVQTML